MSTILDALRKLQRERAAQSPAQDLRGSITSDSSPTRSRVRGAGSRRIAALLALLAIGGGGYVLHRSGQIQALLARFKSADAGAAEGEVAVRESEAAPAATEAAPRAEAPARTPEINPALRARARTMRPGAPPAGAEPSAPAPADTPEIAAERARLEAALVNARAAQEAQRQAELDAAAQQAAAPPPQPVAPPPEPAVAPTVPAAAPPAAAPPAATPPAPKPPAPVVAARPKRVAEKPAVRRPPERSVEPAAPPTSAFPEVRVESIRWHPIAERRVASLHFERQDVPEAREGDIVAGVLVFRIDPGSVELRVGSAQRTISPSP